MAEHRIKDTQLSGAFSQQRRRFLVAAAKHAAMLAALSPLSALAKSAADLSTLQHIKSSHATRLLVISKTLFPHDFIPDTDYANALMYLDRSMTSNPDAVVPLRQVLDGLPADFETLPTDKREAALQSHSDSAFFKQFRRLTISAIYKKQENWQHFGYPGPSLNFGGWVNKKLVDIDWLPVTT